MKVLFVCTANRIRSKTAEDFFKDYKPENEYKSCGINKYLTTKSGGTAIDQKLLDWADKIVCMDHCHAKFIMEKFNKAYLSKIQVLKLEDVYNYGDEELIRQFVEIDKREEI